MKKNARKVFAQKTRMKLRDVIDTEIREALQHELIFAARHALRAELNRKDVKQRFKAITEGLIAACEDCVTDPKIWEENRAQLVEHLTKLMGERLRFQMQRLVMEAIPETPRSRL